MTSFATTSPTGLGLSFDSLAITPSFASSQESFDTLFSEGSFPSSSAQTEPDSASVLGDSPSEDALSVYEDEEDPDINHFDLFLGDAVADVPDYPLWPSSEPTMCGSDSAESYPSSELESLDVERGYEADSDGDHNTTRRRGRKTRRVHHLAGEIQPVTEILPVVSNTLAGFGLGLGLGLGNIDEPSRLTCEVAPEPRPEPAPAAPTTLGLGITPPPHGTLGRADSFESVSLDEPQIDYAELMPPTPDLRPWRGWGEHSFNEPQIDRAVPPTPDLRPWRGWGEPSPMILASPAAPIPFAMQVATGEPIGTNKRTVGLGLL